MNYLKNNKALFWILITAISGGGIGVFSKIALTEISPMVFTLIRFLLGLVILLPFFITSKTKFGLNDFKKVFPISLFGTLNVTLFVVGVRLTTASAGQMLYTFAPLFAGILSYFILKEKIGPKKITGVLVGFIGALTIILLPFLSGHSSIDGGIIGNLIIFTAVCSFSFYSVLSKQLQRDYSPLTLTLALVITTLIVQVLLIPFTYKEVAQLTHGLSIDAIVGCMYVGVFGTGIYYLCFQKAIKEATPVVASMVLYLQPIFTIIWAMALLREKLSFGFIVGTLLAFVGVFLVTNKQNNED